jgi:sulfotransferase family protein
VILSVRKPDAWAASMRETVWGMYHGDSVLHHLCEARAQLDESWRRFMALMRSMTWDDRTGALAGDTSDERGLVDAMERWNADVERTVPPERLLVWDPGDGWEPLCRFLDVDVPDEPLPRINDTAAFREGIIGAALSTLNTWWDTRDRAASGLHGAPLS